MREMTWKILLFVSMALWFATSVFGESESSIVGSGNDKWIIVLLVGVIQGLVGYVYISGLKHITDQIKELRDYYDKLDKEKMDRELHKIICPEDKG